MVKVLVLVASTVVAGLAALADGPKDGARPVASFRDAGQLVLVRETVAAVESAVEAAPSVEEPPALDLTEHGPAPWQKDQATRERERDSVLAREPGDDLDR